MRLIAVAFLLGTIFVTACGSSLTEEQRIANAQSEYDNGRYRASVIELKNLLQENSANKDARILLGLSSFKLGDAAAAEKELTRARGLGATDDEMLVPLLRVLLTLGEFDRVVEEAQSATVTDPLVDAEIKCHVAAANIATGDGDTGATIYRSVIAENAGTEPLRLANLGLAEFERQRANLPAAEQYVERALEIAPDHPTSLLALGQIQIARREFEAAEATLLRGTEQRGAGNIERFMMLAGVIEAQLGLGKLTEAEQSAEKLQEIAPAHPISGYLRGRVAYEKQDVDSAAEFLQGVLAKFPSYRPAQMLYGAVSLAKGDFDQAAMYLTSVVSSEPDNVQARKMLAEARLRLDQPDAAAETLQAAVGQGATDAQLLNMLGRANLAAGQESAGIEFFEQGVAENPDDPAARFALAAAYLSAGLADKARELLEETSVGADDEQRRQMLLLMSAVSADDIDGARGHAETLAQRWPQDLIVNNLVGGFHFAVGELDDARRHFEKAYEADPDGATAVLNLGRLDLQAENYDAAEQRFKSFIERNPTNQLGLVALAQLSERRGDPENALQYMRAAQKAHPEALIPNVALSIYYLRRNDADTALVFAENAVQGNPRSASAYSARGKAMMARNDMTEALSSFRQAIEFKSDSLQDHLLKARTEIALGMLAQARETLSKALRIQPNHYAAAQALAILEIRSGNSAKADDLIARMRRLAPDDAEPLMLEGDVRVAQKKFSEALEAYRKAEKIKPSRLLTLNIYRAEKAAGVGDPIATLKRWLEAQPTDHDSRMLLAQELQLRELNNEAIDAYETILNDRPTHALALNNVAWLYLKQGGPQSRLRALETAELAWKQAPGIAAIADTYGWVLVKSGRIDAGIELLRETVEQATEADPDIVYHLAVALNESGEKTEAKQLLDSILQSDKTFSSRDDAQQMYDSL